MQSVVHLKTQTLDCTILPERGGLISSLRFHGEEVLRTRELSQVSAEAWPDCGIPILFPFCGRVWDQGGVNYYRLGSKRYPMPLHGFLYQRALEVLKRSDRDVVLRRRGDAKDSEIYPFAYELQLHLSLTEDGLSLTLKIENQSSDLMPIYVGIHPFFRVAAEEGSAASLKHQGTIYSAVVEGREGERSKIDARRSIAASDRRLRSGIVSGLTEDSATLEILCRRNIEIQWLPQQAIKHLVLWSDLQKEYFCVEPWMALPDAIHHEQGPHWLKPRETFNLKFIIAVT